MLCAVAPMLLAGCERPSGPKAPANDFLPKASIRELMAGQVDPAADAIWDSVQITFTLSGEKDQQPRTPEEWAAVRRNALMLVEATNLLAIPGRSIVAPNLPRPEAEADPAELQRRLEANPAAFLALTQSLRAVSLKALAAIEAKDPDALLRIGGELDEACEACHLVYWYPPDLAKD